VLVEVEGGKSALEDTSSKTFESTVDTRSDRDGRTPLEENSFLRVALTWASAVLVELHGHVRVYTWKIDTDTS
jgi:hypothetical protein